MAAGAFQFDLADNAKARLAQSAELMVGRDATLEPRPLLVASNGQLITTSGGVQLPEYDHFAVSYVGATNNIDTVTYRLGGAGGTIVGTITVTYVGGVPVADNAKLASVALTFP